MGRRANGPMGRRAGETLVAEEMNDTAQHSDDERTDEEAERVIAMNRITRRRMYAIAAVVFLVLGAWLVMCGNP